jgi:uncharacterized protein (DUF1499 family)
MRHFSKNKLISVLVVMAWLSGCTTAASRLETTAGMSGDDLGCTIPTNCVTTVGSNAMLPLRFDGAVAAGLSQLRATLATFPEAVVTRADDQLVEVVFATRAGFKDTVLFRADAAGRKIDFRSRSGFGLYDFGKNRDRMTDFTARFAQQARERPSK